MEKKGLSLLEHFVNNGLLTIAIGAAVLYWYFDAQVSNQYLPRTITVSLVVIYGGFTQYILNARKRAMEEKDRTQGQLIQSESLAAIGQLSAGIAHELNNPLAGTSSLVQMSIETLKEQEQKDKRDIDGELLENLEFSLKELQKAGNIVRSVLDLSRQTQTYVEDVNMNRVLEDALRVLYNMYKHLGVVVEENYDSDLPLIKGNFANLGQVFINIIKNAVQALPEGKGTITLTTRYNHGKDRIVVECRDNGRGIPLEVQKDIFKPFFTTKEVGKGTGLGLYVSHEIIRKHKGSISVTSEPGKGSAFTVELPMKMGEI
jgi:two-component system NtrC family sensor kinase